MKGFRAIIFVIAFLLVGCSKASTDNSENMSDMEKIQKQLLNMQNYACVATVEHISNNSTKTYETKQFCKKTGEYRLEMLAPESVEGIITTYNGKTICQYNPRVKGEIKKDIEASKYVDEMFLNAFIKNYMQSEETAIATSKFDSSKCTVLEAVIPGENKYLSTEKLWVDNETVIPKQLIIYDTENKERIKVTYKEFKFNAQLDDKIFDISEMDKVGGK